MQQQLTSLVQRLGAKLLRPLKAEMAERTLCSLTCDSRAVEPGALFVALRGEHVDGHSFLPQVAEVGAAAVVCCAAALDEQVRRMLAEKEIAVVEVADTTAVCADIAAWFYGDPASALRLVAITGTNGKTTVATLVEQLLLAAGSGVGVIGTVNNRCTVGGTTRTFPASLTTPEPVELHRLLRMMVDAGAEFAIMEVSSHALDRGRVAGLLYEVAAFTNLSRDHLDYHPGMEAYFEAKGRLFTDHLKPGATAVLPAGGEWGAKLDALLSHVSGVTVMHHGGPGAELALENCRLHLDRSDFTCQVFGEHCSLTTPLAGSYNLENLLTAWGVAAACGVSSDTVAAAVPRLHGAPGRVERVQVEEFWASHGPVVLVDYAHTPDALEKVLEAVAALPHRTLCAVFGCGGDRDGGKRPLMGEVAARLADIAIVTDDNPRSEESAAILAEILPGTEAAGSPRRKLSWLGRRQQGERGTVVIADRSAAIDQAIRHLGEGDVVVIAGKGHEAYQITPQGRRWFDDRRLAESALLSWMPALVAEATGGRLVEGAGVQLLGPVTTDSRVANPDGIFVALKGENHDAHDYAQGAVEQGNRCLLVERELALDGAASQVVVSDTTRALGDLAAFRRRAVAKLMAAQGRKQPLIGLTGSCGKTTVKEMIAAILNQRWPVGEYFPAETLLKTAGNFNNLIGLPLSLLPVNGIPRAILLEMGMNAPGEIARLAEIADPDISLITNVYGAHLEGLGSLDGVAEAKGELFAGTGPEGTLIVNLDDERIVAQAAKYDRRRLTFSVDCTKGADLCASEVVPGKRGCFNFTLQRGSEKSVINLGVAGEHNVANALAAAAVCTAVGTGLTEIAAGLTDFTGADRRMQLLEAPGGFTLINDCYNANPGSMAAGLRVLASFAGTKVAIIGDMLELGSGSEAAHQEIGHLAASLEIDRLAVIGSFAPAVKRGAVDGGMDAGQILLCAGRQEALNCLPQLVGGLCAAEDAVLIKASRGLALEHLTSKLMEAQP